MNWLDLAIAVCIGIGIIHGLFKGLIRQVISFAAIILGVFFAGVLTIPLQPIISKGNMIPPHFIAPFCYFLSFLIIFMILQLLGTLLEKIWDLTPLSFLNYLGGGILGMVIIVITLSLLLNFINIFDRSSHWINEQTKRDSVLYEKVRLVVPTIYPYVKDQLKKRDFNIPDKKDTQEENEVITI